MMKKTLLCGLLLAATPGFLNAYDTPTMGWSSWNTYGINISEALIKSQADAMVSKGLKDAGYQYINIDDGYFGGRDKEGNLLIHPTRFPNGLRPVVDYIHGKGLKAGIYSDAGKNTCASYWEGDTLGVGVGLYGHEQQDMDFFFKELGFDFIKVDYCGAEAGHNVDNLDLPEQERYTAIHDAIVNTGRTDVKLNVCRWAYPGTWVHDLAASWRVTEDIYLDWASVKGIIAQSLYLSAFAYEGHYNDMDMLEVGRGLTEEEDKTHFGMWCIMSSPLIIGCDMSTISDTALALLTNKDLIAINQDPLGLQAHVVKHEGGTYVLVKDIETLNGKTRAVALYNPTDQPANMSIDFFDLDLGGKVLVRDLYAQEDLGETIDSLSVEVPAHGTRIYRLEAEKRYERSRYEGETAFLEAYQELANNESEETGIFEEASYCTGGVKAAWLGKSAENNLQWRNVYSEKGGSYIMRLDYICDESRNVYVSVNGGEAVKYSLNSGSWRTVAQQDIPIELNAGNNVIKLYNAENWMPDIDGMTLVSEDSLEMYQRKLEDLVLRAEAEAEKAQTEGIKNLLTEAVTAAGNVEETEESYTAAIENAIENIENALAVAERAVSAKTELAGLKSECQAIINNSAASESLVAFEKALAGADEQFNNALTVEAFDQCINDLRTAAQTYLKAEDAEPAEGKTWDMSLLMTNPDFDTDASGWTGSPTVSYGVAEFFDKTFETSQTLTGLKNGSYKVQVSALYRTAKNDGGKAYQSGSETIPAMFFVNNTKKAIASLYSWPYDGSTDGMGNADLRNGYIHSMYAASLSFEQGHYLNEMDVDVTDGKLKLGLSCSAYQQYCWCCFDNFRIIYLGKGEVTAVQDALTVGEADMVNVYTVGGVLLKSNVKAADALEGLPKGVYIVGNKKVAK